MTTPFKTYQNPTLYNATMKGIVLAGGTGSRLWPMTLTVSKQLLSVYDKPMIHYPISTLMLAGIREILIITTLHDRDSFIQLLGDGSNLGIEVTYATQNEPKGLAEALIIGEDFLDGDSCLMILGDNIFHGPGLGNALSQQLPNSGCHVFLYEVANPNDYGILELDPENRPISIVEKPETFVSDLAVTGLYFFDNKVSAIAKSVRPSHRGELEITSVISQYLQDGNLTFTRLGRGTAWLDTGTPNSLSDASNYIRIIEERTGLKIACLEEVAWRNGFIDTQKLIENIKTYKNNSYGLYLEKVLQKNL